MDAAEIKNVLADHALWLAGKGSKRANLYGANLYGANLYGANLSEANLYGANLSRANLSRANLYGANLHGANLYGANLSEANLSGASLYGANLSEASLYGANLSRANLSEASLSEANLHGANLYGANLSEANLSGANLYGANLSEASLYGASLPPFTICPEEGAFVGWKRVKGGVVKLLIPAEAKRTSSLVGRKCRAEFAVVLEGEGVSYHDGGTVYAPGLTVYPDKYDDDVRVECTSGIHFFITRKEAEDY